MSALPVGEAQPAERMMTVADVADMLRLSKDTVYLRARSGDLPAVKVGRGWRFLRSEILESLRPKPVDLWAQPPAARRANARARRAR